MSFITTLARFLLGFTVLDDLFGPDFILKGYDCGLNTTLIFLGEFSLSSEAFFSTTSYRLPIYFEPRSLRVFNSVFRCKVGSVSSFLGSLAYSTGY